MILRFPGNTQLFGSVTPSGSVYSLLAVLAASLSLGGQVIIESAPNVVTISKFLSLIKSLGVDFNWQGRSTLIIQSSELSTREVPDLLLLPSMLLRAGEVKISSGILTREISAVLASFGTEFTPDGGILASPKAVSLNVENSLSQSIAALILAARAEGESILTNFTITEETNCLVAFYRSLGFEIRNDPKNQSEIKVIGNNTLTGGNYRLPASEIECAFWCSAVILSGGEITVGDFPKERLISYLSKLTNLGVHFDFSGRNFKIWHEKGKLLLPLNLTINKNVLLYDYLPLLIPLLLAASGVSEITGIDLATLPYIKDLNLFNAKISENKIFGPVSIKGAKVAVPDFAVGLALVLLALAAISKSELLESEKVTDYFDNLIAKLESLGVKIAES